MTSSSGIKPARPFADRLEDGIPLLRFEQVHLVQRDDDRLAGLLELDQSPPGRRRQVLGQHEQDEVGLPGGLGRQRAASLVADLFEARGVEQADGVECAFSVPLPLWERVGVRGVAGRMRIEWTGSRAAGRATPFTPGPSPGGRGEEDCSALAPSPLAGEGWGEGSTSPSLLAPSPLAGEGWGEGSSSPSPSPAPTTRQTTPDTSTVVPPIGPVGRSFRPARALIRLDLPALMIP